VLVTLAGGSIEALAQRARAASVGAITIFPTAVSAPRALVTGADGNVWFDEFWTSSIGRITPDGTVTSFALPNTAAGPYDIAAGPDGNLWFTEWNGAAIGRITPAGQATEFPLPDPGRSPGPRAITAGPDGNLWFTENGTSANDIGQITPSGQITEFPIPTGSSEPEGITVGPDGNLWFTEYNGNNIGRVTPSGQITEFPIPTAASLPEGITAGPDGNLWFTESQGNQIGRITPSGQVTEFPIPTSGADAQGIAAGPDGNLWFTEDQADKIGRITPTGTITEFSLVATGYAFPNAITVGPDGDMWFGSDGDSGQIGRIVPGASAAASTPPPALASAAAAATVGGEVFVQRRGSQQFVPLVGDHLIPFGSTVDATAGQVRVTTATVERGKTQSAVFSGGQFRLAQARSDATTLTLNAALDCAAGAVRSAAAAPHGSSHRATRSLWGTAHGSYTTVGRYASASDLGTRWLTADTCTGTRVTVAEGTVRVTDLVRHRTVVLHAPQSYLAGK